MRKRATYGAYQVWQLPSWQSAKRRLNGQFARRGERGYVRKFYGYGRTPAEAVFNARYVIREDGQTWQKPYAPNASDVSVMRIRNDGEEEP